MKYLIAILLFVSCSAATVENNITVDFTSPQKAYIDDVCKEVNVLSMPDNFITGEITAMKSADDIMLFHDFYRQIIHVYNLESKEYHRLSKIGRAGDEYNSIEAFAYNKWSNQLLINDARSHRFISYQIPEMKVVNVWEDPKSYMNIEYLDAKNILLFCDEEKPRVIIHDTGNHKDKIANIELHTSSMGLSYPQAVSRNGNKLLYAKPFESSQIYSVDSKGDFTKDFTISFGGKAFPQKFWDSEDPMVFGENFGVGDYALMPQYIIDDAKKTKFWFLTSKDNNLNFCAYDKSNNATTLYEELKIKGLDVAIKPIGIYKDYYVTLIYPELVKFDNKSCGELGKRIIASVGEDKTIPILLMYKL